MTFSVRIRRIDEDGRWEEWELWTDAPDEAQALAKVLRRKRKAEFLLSGGRFRFIVTEADRA